MQFVITYIWNFIEQNYDYPLIQTSTAIQEEKVEQPWEIISNSQSGFPGKNPTYAMETARVIVHLKDVTSVFHGPDFLQTKRFQNYGGKGNKRTQTVFPPLTCKKAQMGEAVAAHRENDCVCSGYVQRFWLGSCRFFHSVNSRCTSMLP